MGIINLCLKNDWSTLFVHLWSLVFGVDFFFFPSLLFCTAVFNKEEDIGTYTIKAVDDPRTLNKILYIKPSANIYSFNDLVSLWEKKIGKTLEKVYVLEDQLLKNIEGQWFFPSIFGNCRFTSYWFYSNSKFWSSPLKVLGFLFPLFLQRPLFQWMWYYQLVTLYLWKEITLTLRSSPHLEWKLQSFIQMLNTQQWMSTSISLYENHLPYSVCLRLNEA